MVVDVAVEHADDVGPGELAAGQLELVAVDRVGVGLGDDPHAGPAGVAEHGDLGPLARHRQAQESRRRRSGRASPPCCRRARRSRPPPCTRTRAPCPVRPARRRDARSPPGTVGHGTARRSPRRSTGRGRRGRGSTRRREVRPSRAREPPSGRSPTTPAGSPGSRPGPTPTRHDRRAHRPRGPCAGDPGGSPTARRADGSTPRSPVPSRRRRAVRRRVQPRPARRSGRVGRGERRSRRRARDGRRGPAHPAARAARRRPRRRRSATAAGSPTRASARSRPSTRSAGSGVARVGGRLTTATIPHTATRLRAQLVDGDAGLDRSIPRRRVVYGQHHLAAERGGRELQHHSLPTGGFDDAGVRRCRQVDREIAANRIDVVHVVPVERHLLTPRDRSPTRRRARRP